MPGATGYVVRISVIVPFHQNLEQLRASLAAIRSSVPGADLIVAADGARDDCRQTAADHDARVVEVHGPSGPATARNRAAAVASGDILVFVDTDVVVAPDAIGGLVRLIEADRDVAGVFGSYDDQPAERGFISQFKNLIHAYVHQAASPHAVTFWAGLGAVRSEVFRQVGGFDERFTAPSVEDIDLGYRITQAGYALRLDASLQGKHLKRWTLWSCIVTDVRARGIPWTQLILRYRAPTNSLNTSVALRLSVVCSYMAVLSSAATLVTPLALLPLAGSLAALVGLNFDCYRWFVRKRGLAFAARVVPVHLIHHLCNGASFVVGTVLHIASRRGLQWPGALPVAPWPLGATPAAAVLARATRT
jgi:hypothetical protein